MCVHIEVLSLFPDYIKAPLNETILKRAIQKNLLRVSHHNIRDFSLRKDRRVDDRPFGGGPGMVLSPEPVCRAIRSLRGPDTKVVYLTPQGTPLTASVARELSREKHLVLLCGHYEGIDQRAIDSDVDMQISIGDYVLTNGCLAALVVIDALARFIPGVLGDELASAQDSFEGGVLDCPHYTHPKLFEGRTIPEVLLSGDHEQIRMWRRAVALQNTLSVRPDLLTDTPRAGDDSAPTVQQIIISTTILQKIVRWYSEMLGMVPSLTEGRATFICGKTQLTFIEGPSVSSPWGLLSFMLNADRFSCSQRYAERKKGMFQIFKKEGWLRAESQDPDGRRVEFVTFTKN